jgi:hypothetical protein
MKATQPPVIAAGPSWPPSPELDVLLQATDKAIAATVTSRSQTRVVMSHSDA